MATLMFLAVGGAPALATTFVEAPFTQTVDETPTLVRGRVERIYTHWGEENGDKRIYTYVELKLAEVFKGKVEGSYFVFRQLGGEAEGVGMQVAGAAKFKVGEDIAVTAGSKNGDGSYDLMGLMQGKYEIRQDPDSGEEVLVGAGIESHNGGDSHGHSDTEVKKWSLSQLRAYIAKSVQQSVQLSGKAQENLTKTPVYTQVEAPRPTEAETAQHMAPPLQSKAVSVDAAPETYGWGLLGIAGLAAFFLVFLLLRSKK